MNLGMRLKTVARFVSRDCILADIGTDHAYLPIYLVKEGIISRALAGDVHTGPYQAAQKAVANANLQKSIEVRHGDGLFIVAPGEADMAVIAGMGGTTIMDILAKCPETTRQLKGLILQPMNAAPQLREWLEQNQWQIADEELIIEEGRLYEVIYAVPGSEKVMDSILYEIGPKLWEKRHSLLLVQLETLLVAAERILGNMSASEAAKNTEKYQKIAEKIKALEAKIACL